MLYNKKNITEKQTELKSNKKQRKHSIILIIAETILTIFLLCLVAGVGFGYGSLKGMIANAPDDFQLQSKESSSMLYDCNGKLLERLSTYSSNRIVLSSDQIPEHVKKAFVAIEDERFYEHNGVDIKGMIRAFISDIFSGSAKQGASTITQQLIKNNVFNVGGESNLLAKVVRKIQEQYLALNVEKNYSKDEILTEYLNAINLGKGTLGIEVASNYYYGKKASGLTLSEAASIAAITKNPSNNNPADHPKENKIRRDAVLKKMLELKYINNSEYKAALKEDVYSRIVKNNTKTKVYSYFTDAVITSLVDDLKDEYGYTTTQAYNLVYSGGLRVYTTQDTKLQKIADEIINDPDNYPVQTKFLLEYELSVVNTKGKVYNYNQNDVRDYFRKKNNDVNYTTIYSSKESMQADIAQFRKAKLKKGYTIDTENIAYDLQPQLSYSLMDQSTGEIKVLVGGRGTKHSDLSLNRATNFPRQPGSTFKILSTYAPAIDTCGLTLATVFNDCQYAYENGREIHNANSSFHGGLTTVRDAIIDSNNIVAVKTLTTITPRVGFDFLTKLGFTTLVENRTGENGMEIESDINQALALGGITDGVNNVEMTAAYAAIANQGVYNKPILYTKVEDKNGNVILENEIKGTRVIKESTSWLLTDAMKDVVSEGTGTSARLNSAMAVAGKTGTTSSNYDFWFCGYTPYYTASIWTGYDTNTTFGSGFNYHKQIWAKIMDRIIEKNDLKTKDFPACKDIVSADICMKSGLKPQAKVCSHDQEKNMVRKEYFVKGTVPKKTCDLHVKLTFCKKTKQQVSEYCPKPVTKVYRRKPKDNKGTTADTPYFVPKDISRKKICTFHDIAWKTKKDELKKSKEALDALKDILEDPVNVPSSKDTNKKASDKDNKKQKSR